MNTDYWDDERLIGATLEEKKQRLDYEIAMFRETYKRLSSLKQPIDQFDLNLLVESLAIHVRVLLGFFYNNENPRHKNDIIAQDLLPKAKNWRNVCPPKTDILINAENKADKTLAHLSLWRVQLIRDGMKNWQEYPSISEDLEKVIEKFQETTNNISE